MYKYLKKMITKLNKGLTLLIVPPNGAAVKSINLSFPTILILIILIVINLYYIISVPTQNKQIDSYRKILSQKNLQISALQREHKKLKPTLVKSYEFSEKLNELKQQRIKIIEALNTIQQHNSSKVSRPVNRSRNTYREPKYYLPEFNEKSKELSINFIESNYDQLYKDLETEKLKQEDLLSDILKYSKKLEYIPSLNPLRYSRITSWFGLRIHPKLGFSKIHTGIDMGTPIGTKVYATAAGKVIFAGTQNGYGNLVILDHSYGYQTYYGHNSKILVKQGEMIKKGQLISLSGNTGISTGPHLHYEVRVNGEPVNPILFLNN